MARFEIYSNGTLIGYSDLEHGDPPMGAAEGRLIQVPAFERIRNSVVVDPTARGTPSQKHLNLVICMAGGGEIASSGPVLITDYSAELGPEGLRVEILGVGYPLYEQLFPQHVAAYKKRFSKI